jgi:hypothetical protein
MAEQTRTQRQAAAQKAAATRKRNEAARSAEAARRSAARGVDAAREQAAGAVDALEASARESERELLRGIRGSTKHGRTALASALEALAARGKAVARGGERALLIQAGLVAEGRDALARATRACADRRRRTRALNRLEARGARELRHISRAARSRARSASRELDGQLEDLKAGAGELGGRIDGLLDGVR